MSVSKLKSAIYAKHLVWVVFVLFFNSPAFAQCSTCAWSNVTGTPQPLGESTDPAGKKYEQSCGLTIDATSVPAFVTTSAPTGETLFSVRFYVLSSALSITSGDVTLLTARNGGTTEVELRLRSTGSVKHLVALYRTGGVLTEHPNPIALEDVWSGVEVSWSAGAGDGTFGLKINDFPKYIKNDLVNGSAVINEIDFGVVNAATATGELVIDAFDSRRTSSVGLLTINEMFGISTRADVRTSHEIVIGGFIINGDTKKCVVVRGRGLGSEVPPGEVGLSVPKIDLYEGDSVIASNDDWQDSPEQAQTMQGLGLEPPVDSDSAIYACLSPGGYTVFLTGVNDGTGIGIVEVFDADEGTPYLWGISTRSVVETVHKVAIGGFIIDGDQSKQVVVRGRGPSVGAPDGVTRLSNPQITLYDSTGTPVTSNDDWGDAPNAGDIPPAYYDAIDTLDSMIMTTLEPGAYTAIVSGVGGVTGVGIVEVFDLSGGTITAQ
jgi:hypothetical protein